MHVYEATNGTMNAWGQNMHVDFSVLCVEVALFMTPSTTETTESLQAKLAYFILRRIFVESALSLYWALHM